MPKAGRIQGGVSGAHAGRFEKGFVVLFVSILARREDFGVR
jgi:hypothetical protein